VDRQELLYNASVLALYALVTTQSVSDVRRRLRSPPSRQFVLTPAFYWKIRSCLETAAAQCLLHGGVLRGPVAPRHNHPRVRSPGGVVLQPRPRACERSARKADLLDTLSRHFEP
jgi:hypothetical protein